MAKDWLNTYGAPQGVRRFQEGGAMAPAPEQGAPAPAPEGGGGGADIEGMLAEYAQSHDPQLAVAIADALVEMMAQGGGGGAPAGPEGGAPMARNGMKMRRGPVFRK